MSWKKKKEAIESETGKSIDLKVNEEKGYAKFEIGGEMTAKQNIPLLEAFSEQNNIPINKSDPEHGYESDFLGYKDKCPKCGAKTERMLSCFAYATQEHSRILTAPAGLFCPDCPTVIIDDEMMKDNIAPRFDYYGVFSVDSGISSNSGMFKTFNGEKTLMILTDDHEPDIGGIYQSVHLPSGVQYMAPPRRDHRLAPPAIQQKNKAKAKRKKKAAKKSRRRNKK